jgi:hypothetical protein
MKILLMYNEEDGPRAAGLLRAIEEQGIGVECFPLKPDGNSAGAPPAAGFPAPSHLVALLPPKTVPPWFGFAQGFALGACASLVCVGSSFPRPSFFPKENWVVIQDEKKFAPWLKGAARDWAKLEAPRRARAALLDRGIPISEESFQRCVNEKNPEAAALFLDAGFSPNGKNSAGVPLLNLAVRAGDRETAALLLKAGAGVNGPSGDRGASALLDAALGKHHGIMAELLAAGAETDTKSKDGQSALIIAVGLNDREAAKMLLEAGAKPDEPDSLGASARRYAALFNKPEMTALFAAYPPG